MKICVIESGKTGLEKFLSEPFLEMSKDENEIILGAVDEEGVLMSFAMINIADRGFVKAGLDFVYTYHRYRRMGIASELLREAERILSEAGISIMTAKVAGNSDYQKGIYKFLNREAFSPVSFGGGLLVYEIRELVKKPLVSQSDKLKQYLDNILSVSDVDESRLKSMSEKILYDENYYVGCNLKKQDFDPKLSKLYIEDGKILGGFYVEKIDEKTLAVLGAYISPKSKQVYILPTMIAASLKEIMKQFDIEDMKVIMQIHKKWEYKGIVSVFGQPESETVINEYFLYRENLKQKPYINSELENRNINAVMWIRERLPGYEAVKVNKSKDEDLGYYQTQVLTGGISEKYILGNICRIMSTYGMRRLVLLVKSRRGLELDEDGREEINKYKNELDAYLGEMGLKQVTGENIVRNTGKDKELADSISAHGIEKYINSSSVGWKKSDVVFYYLYQLNDSYFSGLMKEKAKLLPKVERISDRNDARLDELLSRVDGDKIGFDREIYDERYSRFYIQNGKIRACMVVERPFEKYFIIRGYYLEKSLENDMLPGTLLWNILENLTDTLGEDVVIALEIKKKKMFDFYTKIFGEGFKHLRIDEEVSPEGMSMVRVKEDEILYENKDEV